jgi:ketosteroid isomerase-like protein
MSAPIVVNQYLQAANGKDFEALADCFTPDGTVLDEGHTHTGRAEIIGWREDLALKYTYTSTVTGSTPLSDDRYRVNVRVEGDFPGGVAELSYDFTLSGELISDLRIAG